MNAPVVIFQSKSKYSWFLIILPIFVIGQVFVQLGFALSGDASVDSQPAVKGLVITLLCLTVVFGLVLPSRFEILSDSSINVVTLFGKTWNFSEAVEAHRLESVFSELCRPKWKFGTAMEAKYRIVIRRGGYKWDMLVSPAEPDEFMRLVNNSGKEQLSTSPDAVVS